MSKRLPSTPPDDTLALCELFASIQGEGYWVGRPMLFIRFWGCPLSCPFCDEPRHRNPASKFIVTIPELLDKLRALHSTLPYVVLTGGEPLAAPNLDKLVAALKQAGYWLALETSGVGGPIPAAVDWVTLSPKTPVDETIWQRAQELKFIVGPNLGSAFRQEIVDRAASHSLVWVQPRANGSQLDPNAVATCLELVMNSRGRLRLSMQIHKWLGVP